MSIGDNATTVQHWLIVYSSRKHGSAEHLLANEVTDATPVQWLAENRAAEGIYEYVLLNAIPITPDEATALGYA